MVLQREGADELQNRRATAAFIRCWGAGEQKRSLSPRSTTSQIVPNPQVVKQMAARVLGFGEQISR